MASGGGYSDAVIDELWLNLKYIHRDMRAGRPDADIYWALDIIRVLDEQPRIYHQGDYMRIRPYVLRRAQEMNITPMFQVILTVIASTISYL